MQDNWFVKLHRKLLDNPISSNPLLIWLFCYLLLIVSYKDHIFFLWKIRIEQKKGQAIISKKDIAKSFGISRWTLDSYLGVLQIEHMISIKTTSKYTVVTIVNWDKYQTPDIKIASNWTTTWTSTWHQLEHQPDTINKDKNIEERKEREEKKEGNQKFSEKECIERFGEKSKLYIPQIQQAIKDFVINRYLHKDFMTQRACELLWGKLWELAKTDQEAIEMLNEATINSWKSVYPLKKQNNYFDKKEEEKQKAYAEIKQRRQIQERNNNYTSFTSSLTDNGSTTQS